MLILSRRPNEAIRIGDDIEVMVLSVDGRVVRLGISAPRELRVDRQEVRERMERETDARYGVSADHDTGDAQ